MTGRKWVLAGALLAAALLRPAEATAQEACGTLRDEGLVMKVQAKLQFSEAERIAASVPGVRRVRNTLRVESQ